MTTISERLYEDTRRQILIDIRYCPIDDWERYSGLVSSLKELEDAYTTAKSRNIDDNKKLTALLYIASVIGVAILDRHVPIVSTVFNWVSKPKLF